MWIFHLAFIALLVGTELFFSWLDRLNISYAEEKIDAKASWLRQEFGVDEPGELKDYLRMKTGFSRLKSILGLVGLLFFL